MGRARVAAAFAVLSSVAWVSASCRDIVVGEPVDAVGELCDVAAACFGDVACNEIQEDAGTATDAQLDAFLVGFDPSGCLGSCSGARACLDAPPFCGQTSCDTDYDCCGWSLGIAACGAPLIDQPDVTQCCKPSGIECNDSALCCTDACVNGFCGGYECQQVGAECAVGSECCTGLCFEDRCAEISCSLAGGGCTTDEDCCDAMQTGGVALVCDKGTCTSDDPTECAEQGELCSPDGNILCCDEALECVGGACGLPGCVPEGELCSSSEDCCGAENDLFVCGPASTCVPAGAGCGEVEAMCNNASDCCAPLECRNGACREPVCEQGACHDPCQVGAAMKASCFMTSPGSTTNLCVTNLFASHPACFCTQWRLECVEAIRDNEACSHLCWDPTTND